MDGTYADILFALYMNGGRSTLDWLLAFGAPDAEAQTRKAIGLLAFRGLIQVRMEGEQAHIALTEAGEDVALGAAELISDRMLADWGQPAA